MKTKTAENIVSYIERHGPTSPGQLATHLQISTQAVHAQIRKLLSKGKIYKIGSPPDTHYGVTKPAKIFPDLNQDILTLINQEFSFLSPKGKYLVGLEAFQEWIVSKELEKDFLPLAKAYKKTWHEIYGEKKQTPINTLPRLQSILSDLALNSCSISDFYAIPQFGKTRLGNLIHGIKTAFNQKFLKEIAETIHPDLEECIRKYNIEAIVYTPHSIPRKKQFLPGLRNTLKIELPEINVKKIFQQGIPVAQKSLARLSERIENARSTLILEPFHIRPKSVLLIDDAIGSGATLNELARILKKDYSIRECHAYAVVGSYKGFDVISPV